MVRRILTSENKKLPYETIEKIDAYLKARYPFSEEDSKQNSYHKNSPSSIEEGVSGIFTCELNSENIEGLELTCLLIAKKHPEIRIVRPENKD